MARPLSVASVIDKNKVVSNNAWLILLDIKVIDPNTLGLVETLRVAKNNEAVVFNGQTYQPANFDFQFRVSQNDEPSFTLTAQDQTRFITSRIDQWGGGTSFKVILTIVNSARLDQPPELREEFSVLNSSTANYVVNCTLGAENMLTMRFPRSMQFQQRCRWRFKDSRCAYTGAAPTCDYTLDGENGCAAKNNNINFGGFPGLRRLNV